MVSNVTGEFVKEDELSRASYWRNQLRSTVLFRGSMERLWEEGYRRYVEVGPGTALLAAGQREEGVWAASLRRGREDWEQMLESLGRLYVEGGEIDWEGYDGAYGRKRVSLPTYPFQRQRHWLSPERKKVPVLERAEEGREQLFYEVEWRERERKEASSGGSERGRWVLFGDGAGVGKALGEALSGEGQESVWVRAGPGYESEEEGKSYRVNPESRSDFDRLFEQIGGASESRLRGVVYLWGLDAEAADESMTPASLGWSLRRSCGGLLHLVQSLGRLETGSGVRLWVVTAGAATGQPESPALTQAPLWGFGRVVALERPEIWGGLIDITGQPSEEQTERLLSELMHPDGEDEVVLRPGARRVSRLARVRLRESEPLRFRESATYWVVGGLGGLGSAVARWMVEQGARHLLLSGRRGVATREAEQSVTALESKGARVQVAKVDITDRKEMEHLLAGIEGAMPPLKGVVHCAGVTANDELGAIELEGLEEVLGSKTTGAWNLHQLTRERELDFFVCFSSIASVWGSKGQAHYAAANQALDALAWYRRGQGLPATSINWGPCAGAGMVTQRAEQWLRQQGLGLLPPSNAAEALGRVLRSGPTQVTVADVD
ncbi:MAG: SDR family NAD(P)-dependent oxidoreductase, partial [Acidobacteria bacterium]|nr:SDR family NAD(P)-dependent oxidoreductase [Acidobacteriota bacterium]